MVRLRLVPTEEAKPYAEDLDGPAIWPTVYEKLSAKQVAIHFEREIIGFVGTEFFSFSARSPSCIGAARAP